MIRFDDVSFGYGARPVLDHFSLEVQRGELFGLIGRNGAGKSTAVRLGLGLLRPQSGRVFLDGRDIAQLTRGERRNFARRVAAVTQEETVEFPFTALEVVLTGRTPHLGALGFERARDLAAAERAMEWTGVSHLGGRLLHELSGGERKRVLLARALAQDPEVLLLDEPADALDIHHQIAIFDLLGERRRQGLTVLVVVHDLNLAAAYCDRVALLRSEAPPSVGTVAEVLTYQNVRDAFGVDVYVGINEVTGSRFLLPMSSAKSG